MNEYRDSKNRTEWWGVYQVNTLIAVFASKLAAVEWLAWNSTDTPDMHVNPVRNITVGEDARITPEGICRQ